MSHRAGAVDQEILKKVESYQYPKAHVGHLGAGQLKKLDELKQLSRQKGYWTPAGPAGQPASHDDETLLRYLRARKFNVQDAFGQFKDTEDWRKTNEIDKLYDTIELGDYDETRVLYPQWTGRRDKRGVPVYVFEVAPLNSKRMKEYEKSMAAKPKHKGGNISRNLYHLFALYENLIQFAFPLCSGMPNRPFPDTPVSQSINIVDITGVGIKQFWDLKGHMQEGSQLATAYYPETLDRIFIIGAPSFFPTVWSWIKRWFDPITVSKIFILSPHDTRSTLVQYMNIEDIPTKYGGKLNWKFGDGPSLDPEIGKAMNWAGQHKTFPAGPVRWRTDRNGDMTAVALGSSKGKQRDEVVGTLPGQTGAVLPRTVAAMDFGPSTSGTHTHPDDSAAYFPTSGATPPDSEASSQASDTAPRTSPPINTGIRNDPTQNARLDPRTVDDQQTPRDPTPTATSAGRTVVDERIHNESMQTPSSEPRVVHNQQPGPIAFNEYIPSPPLQGTTTNMPVRQGTSSTRYEAQSGTHAAGEVAQGTPTILDDDKGTVIEPATLGQAPKDVSVPEAKPPEPEQQPQQSYLDQAKAAIGSVITVAEGAGESVLGAVGYGGRGHEEADASHNEATRIISGGNPDGSHLDDAKNEETAKKVDQMDKGNVEDFIRSQYTTAHKGEKAKKAAAISNEQ